MKTAGFASKGRQIAFNGGISIVPA